MKIHPGTISLLALSCLALADCGGPDRPATTVKTHEVPKLSAAKVKPGIKEIASKAGWRDALLSVKGLDPRIAVLTFYERTDIKDDVLMVISSEGSTFAHYRVIFLQRNGEQAKVLSALVFRPRLWAAFSVKKSGRKVIVLAESHMDGRSIPLGQIAVWPE